MIREYLEKMIKNFNGNPKVIGILKNGDNLVLDIEFPNQKEDELVDFTTGMVFKLSQFKEFKNYSNKYVYSHTKNHHIKNDGSYVHGGQNIKRWEAV